jgi:hypothetical protein
MGILQLVEGVDPRPGLGFQSQGRAGGSLGPGQLDAGQELAVHGLHL